MQGPSAIVDKKDARATENLLTIDLTRITLPDEATINVDAVLKATLGAEGGPSVGGISPHKLAPYMQCQRKGYWSSIRGLVPAVRPRFFNEGSAFHAAMELHFGGGGRRSALEVPDALLAAGAPEMGGLVKRMIHSYLGKFAAEQAVMWDIRGIEEQLTHFEGPFRIGGKNIYLPLTCRVDMLVAILNPGQPRAPFGPHPNGVWLHDFKTSARYNASLVSKYNRDVQFRMNAYIFLNSAIEAHGKLNGVIVDVVLKGKKIDKVNGAERLRVSVSPMDLHDVRDYYVPLAVELADKATDEEYRKDYRRWPCNDTQCQSQYPCPFYDLCDYGESMLGSFKVNPSHIVDPSRFLEPPKQLLQARKAQRIEQAEAAGVEIPETKRKKGAALRKQNKDLVLHYIEVEEDRPFNLISPREVASLEDKQPIVRKAVVDLLKDRCAPLMGNSYTMMVGPEESPEELKIGYKETGLSWLFRAMKGTLGWAALAKHMTRHWWDPAANETASAPPAPKKD